MFRGEVKKLLSFKYKPQSRFTEQRRFADFFYL